MKPEQIRAIALEVAKEMGFRCVEDYILFATRFLAAITAKAEPVAEVGAVDGYWWGDRPKNGTRLFTHPSIEPAPVELGVDWGRNGDISCVSTIKKHANGTPEVVACEYECEPDSGDSRRGG